MLDIKFIRQNPKIVKEGCRKKQVKVDIDRLLGVDKKRREISTALEDMQAKKNKASKEIASAKNEKEKRKIILEMKELDKNNDRLDANLKAIKEEFNKLIFLVPNLPREDVPFGKDEKDNVVLREVGERTKFGFEPKDYLALSEKLDLIDTKRAAKVAGARFGYLKRETVLIEFALIKLALDELLKEGFVPLLPPVMLKEDMARGTGYFEAADRKEAYFLQEDKLYLIGTAEQSIVAMHSEEILNEKDLPKRYVAFSTCFRREAGAYGKDTRGILRVHQFDKVEMFSFCKPEESEKEHNFFLEIEEKLMSSLKIPYRVVKMCTGDLGFPAAAKYDIEAWLPSENRYRETHSTSNCTDFQARRLNIRYRDKTPHQSKHGTGQAGKLNFVHTVNGTAFSQRPIIAIFENCQQKDGAISVPEVLRKYLSFKEIRR